MENEIPIACSLNERELQERRKDVLQKVGASLIDFRELENGFSFHFPTEDALLQDLMTVVSLERKCCPFLNFKLIFEAGNDLVSLELTGREGAKEAVESLFKRSFNEKF